MMTSFEASNTPSAVAMPHYDESDRSKSGFLEGELLDLYGAILIVVPVAVFLKSLWF
jgi:hypothetical protein